MSGEERNQLIDTLWVCAILLAIALSVFLPWCLDCP